MKSFKTIGKKALTAASLLALFGLGACNKSIYEDRSQCDSWLTYASDGYIEDSYPGGDIFFIAYQDGSLHLSESRSTEDFTSGNVWWHVAEGATVDVVGLHGVDKGKLNASGGLYTIPYGYQCDSLYETHLEDIYMSERDVRVYRPLNKDFMTLTIMPNKDNWDGTEGEYAYDYVLQSGWDGYYLPSMEPHAGEFQAYAEWGADGRGSAASVRLPRQGGEGLQMRIIDRANGEYVGYVDIYKILEGMGYDWTSDDLQDAVIEIDWAYMRMSITVNDWTRVVVFELWTI